jgi:hypothetical protein
MQNRLPRSLAGWRVWFFVPVGMPDFWYGRAKILAFASYLLWALELERKALAWGRTGFLF